MSSRTLELLKAVVLASGGALAGCGECENVVDAGETVLAIPGAWCETARCKAFRTQPCAETCATFADDGALEVVSCTAPVPSRTDPESLTVTCRFMRQRCDRPFELAGGRPQVRLVPRGASSFVDPVGRAFADGAEAEESSVHAFVELSTALTALGAPEDLARECLRAAEDEERHRLVFTALARAHGAEPSRAPATSSGWPSLEALACENATQGCVAELWAAVLVVHASFRAASPATRRALATIADDEARHVELAQRLDTYLAHELPPDARTRVEDARDRAVRALAARVQSAAEAPALVAAGLAPSRRVRLRLFGALFGADHAAPAPRHAPVLEALCPA